MSRAGTTAWSVRGDDARADVRGDLGEVLVNGADIAARRDVAGAAATFS